MPTMLESLGTATANRSSRLVGSLVHNNSPTTATHTSLYLWYPLITDSIENEKFSLTSLMVPAHVLAH